MAYFKEGFDGKTGYMYKQVCKNCGRTVEHLQRGTGACPYCGRGAYALGIREVKISNEKYRRCPACQEPMLAVASVCPYCRTQSDPDARAVQKKKSDENFQKVGHIVIAILVVFLVFALFREGCASKQTSDAGMENVSSVIEESVVQDTGENVL